MMSRVLIALLCAALAGGVGWWLGAAWPQTMGVILTAAERAEAGRLLAGAGAVGGGLLGALLARRWRWLVALGLVVLGAVWRGTEARPAAQPRGPDLLLITLDTARADHFDFIGGDVMAAHTPALSALAERAVVFTEAFSPVAITGPAHTSMLSGQHPLSHAVLRNGVAVPEALPWVPEQLQQAGWSCEAWVSAAVLDASLGFARGFSRYDSAFADRLALGHPLLASLGEDRRGSSARFSRAGAQTVAAVLEAERPAGQKIFTWVHLYDAHWPYTPSEAAAAAAGLPDAAPLPVKGLAFVLNLSSAYSDAEIARGKALYRAGLGDLDAQVAALLAWAGDAPVVVVGDHGESLGEHELLFSHGRLAFAPDTKVPLLIAAPQLPPARVDALVETTAVAPTLLALAGLADEAGTLLAPAADQQLVAVAAVEERRQDEGDTTLGALASVVVRQGDRSVGVSRWHDRAAYDRARDPRELHPQPISAGDPLSETMARIIATGVAPAASEDGLEDALRALGYVE